MVYHKPYTIMIADDDSEDRELFRELFEHQEHFMLLNCLESGIEVFDEIIRKKNIPNVLLIDMYMPFFTGIDVVKALQELKAEPEIFKFVTSTVEYIPEMEMFINNPYVIFVRKPVTSAEINALPNLMLDYLKRRLANVS
ncbi:MAG: response regulator [Flavobacterium sp.]